MSHIRRWKNGLMGSAVLLCVFSLATKALGMLFRVYLSNRIGSEGMGLYQLVLSVYTLFTTFATAGLTVSVSRLTGEALGASDPDRAAIRAEKTKDTGIAFALLLGIASLGLMLAASGITAKYLLSDARTSLPMKILSLSMPFMAAAACYKGYYIASRRAIITASAQLFEQLVKIAAIYACFALFMSETADIGTLTVGIAVGLSFGEAASCIYFMLFDVLARGKVKLPPGEKRLRPMRDITGVVLPIAASSYVTGILHTAESVLIPFCLSLYGGDRAKSLSEFGLIRGMVIPALFFPFAFLAALTSTMIPEISRLNTDAGRRERDAKIIRVLRFSFAFGIASGGLFLFLPREIGMTFYNSPEAEYPMRLLAAVTPFMYVETVCDGILKSIGGQLYTLRIGVINSAARIVIMLLLLPRAGSEGYIWLLAASNVFSFAMLWAKTRRSVAGKLGAARYILVPAVGSAASGVAARVLISQACLSGAVATVSGTALYLAVFAAVFLPVYINGNGKHI